MQDEKKISFEEDYELTEDEDIITLSDEEGNDVRFIFLDLISYEGKDYAILLPEDDETGEVEILEVEEDGEEEDSFTGVDDDELLNTLYNIFNEKYKDFL